MSEWHGGKGSGRRKEDSQAVRDGWDRIFNKGKTMIDDEPQERSDEDNEEQSDDDWCCEVCGGPMYHQPHWNYAQCDDCGARQELENDDY